MAISERHLLDSLGLMPFIDSAELAGILGEPHATVQRALTGLLADGNAGRVSHGTAHLPSSQRYYLTTKGLRQATGVLGFATPSDFVRAYPLSREWLALLIRRMDAVAAVYRLAALMSPGTRSRRSHVEFHRRGRFDATITLQDGRDFGVVRQGLALRRRSRTGSNSTNHDLNSADTIATFAEEMSDSLKTSELTETRAFVHSFVKEVEVKPGKAAIV